MSRNAVAPGLVATPWTEDWDAMHAAIAAMKGRGHGTVINVSSLAGFQPSPFNATYGATKAFVAQFSLNLRADLSGTNVRVTNIEPGMADTEFSTVRFHGAAEQAAKVYEGATPLVAELLVTKKVRGKKVEKAQTEPAPTIAASAIGVSMTRASPNRSRNP